MNKNKILFRKIIACSMIISSVFNTPVFATPITEEVMINEEQPTKTSTKGIIEDNMLLGAVAKEWLSSNIREWLNSDKDKVDYTGLPPSYKNEEGFLSNRNFTQEERDAIAVTRHGGGWQYSLDSNQNATLYVSQRSVAHNDYEYNDKVFILHYTDLYFYLERNNQLLDVNKKYYSNYLQKITNKKDKYDYIMNSGYYSSGYRGTNEMYTSTLDTVYGRSQNNIVPALSLKPEYTLSNGIKAKDLRVGDTVNFGRYNGEDIEWQVITKSNTGYPTLWSTKILTLKEYDAPGDINPQTSKYIDFPKEEVSILSGAEAKSWETQNTIDSTPVITIENESVLTTPTNEEQITIKIRATDSKYGIRKITLPDGTVVNGDTAEYTIKKNGEFDLIAENTQGVITVRHVITKAINTPAEVTITTDKDESTKWTNKPVNVTVSATNNGVYLKKAPNSLSTNANSNGGRYPDWMPLGGKRVRFKGTLIDAVKDEDVSKINMNAKLKLRISMQQYSIGSKGMSYPLLREITLKELKEKGRIEIDDVYVIPDNAYALVMPYISLMDGNSDYTGPEYKYGIQDFTFEILDKDDLKIEEIRLPDGNVVHNDSATYVIKEAGSYTFSAVDNRGKETSKTIEILVDTVRPELEITGMPINYTSSMVTLNVNAKDSLSGVRSIKLPNGEVRNNTEEGKPLSIDYNITKNGSYTFEVTDFAGNKTSQTVTINKIDKNAPELILTLNPDTWTNDKVVITATAIDSTSGVSEIILPNGNVVKGTTANFTTTKNGSYSFIARDNAGLSTLKTITVSNIDKKNPTVSIENKKEWTKENVPVTITGTDK